MSNQIEKDISTVEAKIYKRLYREYRCLYHRILMRAKNRIDYPQGEEQSKLDHEFIEIINNIEKYDYYGLVSKEDAAVIKVLENLLEE